MSLGKLNETSINLILFVRLGATIVEVPILEGLLEYSRVSHTVSITSEMTAAVSTYYCDESIR